MHETADVMEIIRSGDDPHEYDIRFDYSDYICPCARAKINQDSCLICGSVHYPTGIYPNGIAPYPMKQYPLLEFMRGAEEDRNTIRGQREYMISYDCNKKYNYWEWKDE